MINFQKLIKQNLIVIIVGLLGLAGGIGYQLFMTSPLPEHSLYYQPQRPLYNFEFEDQHGKRFNNQSLQGKWSWVFLGYTSCPDVCPTTMQSLAFSYKEMLAIADNTQVILLSVDPNRDTQQRLSQYTGYFNDEFIALRGAHDQLFPFTQNIGLMYAITDSTSPEGYLVDHSAAMVLLSPEGKVAAIIKPDHAKGQVTSVKMKKLLSDFAKIVQLH